MPNWVSTKLSVSGSKEEVQRFVDGIKDSRILESYIPCPTELHETVSGFFADEEKAKEQRKQQDSNIAKHGHKDWYDWQYSQWGTKWGDCDTDVGVPLELPNGSWSVQIHYTTAWGPASEGFGKISKMFPSLVFCFDYDEEAGFFAGIEAMQDGDVIFEDMYSPNEYEGTVDHDDDESYEKYMVWKEKQEELVQDRYEMFLKGLVS